MSAEKWSSYRGTIPTYAFHPSKCAVTYARITSLYKETAEAFRRRLYLVEVYPFRRICWRRIAMAACGSVGGVHLRPGGEVGGRGGAAGRLPLLFLLASVLGVLLAASEYMDCVFLT